MGDGAGPRVRVAPALPDGARNLITAGGAAAVRGELAGALAERARLRGADDGVSQARFRALADDITWLEARIASLVVTEAPERVGFGTVVEIDDGERVRRVGIVGVDEADPGAGRVSWVSPLARALIGARVGDEVTVQLPRGPEVVTVIEITALAVPPGSSETA